MLHLLLVMVCTALAHAADHGQIVNLPVTDSVLSARELRIYLPPGYSASGRYPVLYLNDGQNLFDTLATQRFEWRVDETLDSLIAAHALEPLIVAGIPHAAAQRRAEYVPQAVLDRLDTVARPEFLAFIGTETMSQRYLHFLTTVVKPLVDRQFATDTTRTWIGGSSTGAVSALAAACEYPQVFTGAMCFSTHWVGLHRQNIEIPRAYLEYLHDRLPPPDSRRFYFDCGDQGLDSLYAPHQARVDSLFRAHGYSPAQYQSQIHPGHDHSERDWAKRFGEAVIWLTQPK